MGSNHRHVTDLQGVTEDGFFHAVMSDVAESLELSEACRNGLRYRADEESYDGRDFSHDVRSVIDELKGRTRGHVKLADAGLSVDETAEALSETIARRVDQELQYPGQIRVTVIRETRATDVAK